MRYLNKFNENNKSIESLKTDLEDSINNYYNLKSQIEEIEKSLKIKNNAIDDYLKSISMIEDKLINLGEDIIKFKPSDNDKNYKDDSGDLPF